MRQEFWRKRKVRTLQLNDKWFNSRTQVLSSRWVTLATGFHQRHTHAYAGTPNLFQRQSLMSKTPNQRSKKVKTRGAGEGGGGRGGGGRGAEERRTRGN